MMCSREFMAEEEPKKSSPLGPMELPRHLAAAGIDGEQVAVAPSDVKCQPRFALFSIMD
jgi:hypothetical protein